jgi:ankyrin repeat protein
MRNSLKIHAASALLLTAFLWAGSPPEAPVADAAMRGDLDAVQELLSRGADVNAAQGDGMTGLHWAAEMGNAEMAGMLLGAGASVRSVTRLGDYTPLHLAAKNGHPEVAGLLLEAGADVEAVTSTGGARALHFAAQTAHPELVQVLLEHGADVNARETFWGQTPLMFAASAARADVVRQLLAAGADPSLRSKVLDVAARAELDNAAQDIRQEVLEGFRGDRVAGGEGWLPSPDEVQAAVTAARNVPTDVVEDPELADIENPGLPHLVEREGGSAKAEAPAAPSGEDVGGNAEGYDDSYAALVGGQGGLTALLHAVREGNVVTTMALLDGGADINQASGGDQTSPLLMATVNGHFDLALQLLERGADPNVVSDAGAGPLFAVINTEWAPKARYPQQQAYLQQQATHLDMMKALLEAGADPNQRLTKHIWYMEYTFSHLGVDMRGATPFWRAAHGLDVPAMTLLVAYGADPNIPTMKAPERRRRGGGGDETDPSGLPPVPAGGPAIYPIHAATGHGYGTGYAGNSHRHAANAWLPAVRYLVEEVGADVNARDENGYSPLHNAASRGDIEVIQYLLEHGADPMVVSREGQTAVDMANGPQQRIQPFPDAIRLLEAIGVPNNHQCVSC